jgi:hypothetical protein
MSNALVVLKSTRVEQYDKPLAGYVFTLNGTESKTVSADPLQELFTDVPVGDNSVSVQAVDAEGLPLGSPVSIPFQVVAPPVLFDVPVPDVLEVLTVNV